MSVREVAIETGVVMREFTSEGVTYGYRHAEERDCYTAPTPAILSQYLRQLGYSADIVSCVVDTCYSLRDSK